MISREEYERRIRDHARPRIWIKVPWWRRLLAWVRRRGRPSLIGTQIVLSRNGEVIDDEWFRRRGLRVQRWPHKDKPS